MPTIIHQTDRLHLTSWDLADFPAFAQVARDPKVMHFIAEGEPWPDSRIGWFMGQQAAWQRALGYCLWQLRLKSSGEMIGFCGLCPLAEIDEVEIGWWLKPGFWRQGYAVEAAQQTVHAAFKDHQLKRIVARAYADNARSIRLMDKLGMRFAKPFGNGPRGPIVLYALAAAENKM